MIIKHLTKEGLQPGKSKNKPAWFDELSKREKQVLKLISSGLNNHEIAEELFIAEQTVKNHVSLIYNKLGSHDRLKVIRMAKEYL